MDHEDLEQLDEFTLEEIELKWQVAMISMRVKKFYKKTGHFARECRIKGNQDNRRRDAWNSRNKDGRRSGKQEDSKALVTIDREGVDWTSQSEEEEGYALMACNSLGSDTEGEVTGKRISSQKSQKQAKTTRKERDKCIKSRENLKPFSKPIKAGSARQQEKKVNEDPIEVKGSIMTSFQSSRAHLDVLKVQAPKMSKLESWFIKKKRR
ncbi:hypothetical protein Tco_1232216 [Tanacetum coccineum]